MSRDYHIIPVFVPHRGCPHDCVFCNQKKITGLNKDLTGEEVDKLINEYIKTIPETNQQLEVAFYGGSFTGIDISTQKELLKAAYKYKKEGQIDRIRLSTRPDYIDDEILNMLKQYGVDIIELGVQSMDEEVLLKSNRGHTSEDVKTAVNLIKKYKFTLGIQIMIGLPGDAKEQCIYTAKEIIKLYPDFVRIYPTLVVKETYLEKMFLQGKYLPLSLDKAIYICTDLLMLFTYANIPVIRIGLQPTKNISINGDIVSGPFHESFRQLVESNFYRVLVEEYFSKKDKIPRNIVIKINYKEISNFVGQRKENIEYIKARFDIKSIKVVGENISKDYLIIINDGIEEKLVLIDYINKYLLKRNLID